MRGHALNGVAIYRVCEANKNLCKLLLNGPHRGACYAAHTDTRAHAQTHWLTERSQWPRSSPEDNGQSSATLLHTNLLWLTEGANAQSLPKNIMVNGALAPVTFHLHLAATFLKTPCGKQGLCGRHFAPLPVNSPKRRRRRYRVDSRSGLRKGRERSSIRTKLNPPLPLLPSWQDAERGERKERRERRERRGRREING